MGDLVKLNSSSAYYNDFCYTATSDSGTDITLKDRKNEYPSKAVCQDDCDFDGYNDTSKKAKCSCVAKKSSSSFADMKIDKNKLLDNFKNIKNIANVKILKCFKVLFSKKGISENVGFYILIAIIIFHTIVLYIFFSKTIDLLVNKIKELIFSKNNLNPKKGDTKEEEKSNEIIKIESKEKKEIKDFKIKLNIMNDNNMVNNGADNINNEVNKDDNKIQFKKKGKKVWKRKTIKVKKGHNSNSNSDNIININNIIKNMNNNTLNNDIIIINKKKYEIKTNNISEKNIKIDDNKELDSLMEYNEEELNDLSYDLALQNDKRTFWQYYISFKT